MYVKSELLTAYVTILTCEPPSDKWREQTLFELFVELQHLFYKNSISKQRLVAMIIILTGLNVDCCCSLVHYNHFSFQ